MTPDFPACAAFLISAAKAIDPTGGHPEARRLLETAAGLVPNPGPERGHVAFALPCDSLVSVEYA